MECGFLSCWLVWIQEHGDFHRVEHASDVCDCWAGIDETPLLFSALNDSSYIRARAVLYNAA